MEQALLSTKFLAPHPRPGLVPRPRLVTGLDDGLRLGHRLALISAPAGSGKTTLVSEWLSGSDRSAAWLSLDEGDNDPVRFVRYLVAAIRQIDAGVGHTVLPLLESPQFPQAPVLVTALINEIAALGTAFTLVLDDYHLITSEAMHALVGFLLDNAPPLLHLTLTTREDPPFALARMRARGQITEIRQHDLRFTSEEAAEFLRDTMGLDLSAAAIDALEARTEGWIAGLQMAALALQKDDAGAGDFIDAFTGSDRYIMDYLVEEVLNQQPEALQTFLRETAVLESLSAPLCDAVTGRTDSREMLNRLEAANLFLIPLDHQRAWYRYHRIFADFLRMACPREQQVELHRRAGDWFEAQGFMDDAIHHALVSGALSGDLSGAARLIHRAAGETFHRGGVMTVAGWLNALPDEQVRAHGELATYQGWVLALTGGMGGAYAYADAAAEAFRQAGGSDALPGHLLTLRGFLALLVRQDYAQSVALAEAALRAFDVHDDHWRLMALWLLAESQERTARITESIATLREASRAGQSVRSTLLSPTVDVFLATALNAHGERRAALTFCEEAIARFTGEDGRVQPAAGMLLGRLGSLHFEANRLDDARDALEQGLALISQLNMGGALIAIYGALGQVRYALGEPDSALDAIRQATRLAAETGFTDVTWSQSAEAHITLRQGDVLFAQRWADDAGLSVDDAPDYLLAEEHLVFARLLLAQGRLDEAQAYLARLADFFEERELVRWLITARLLEALAADRAGAREEARSTLTDALTLAAPEQYSRAFLDEDAALIALLPDVRQAAPAFVDGLLEAAGVSAVQPVLTSQPLIEPLSDRELEVLHLIAAGHSNRDISERLYITVGTVKRHINNIYGKLDVHSRTEAVAKARALHILR